MDRSISNLDKALPVSGRALSLRKDFNQSLLGSLKYLIQACEDVLSSSVFSKALQKIEKLEYSPKVSGFLSLLHENLLRAIEKEDIDEVKALVKHFVSYSFDTPSITYLNYSDLDEDTHQDIKKLTNSQVIEKITFYPLKKDEFEEMKASVQDGFSVLKRSFPDFYDEAECLVSEVLFLSGERKDVKVESNRFKISGSSCNIFGMIYLNFLHKWKTITDALDFIIHELSHLYIYAINKDDPLLLNPGDMYESPLRTEPRPLMGSYHATFVLSRIVYVLKKALEINEIPDEEKEYCKEVIAFYQKRFHLGYDLMTERAKMTDLAKNLIESTTKLVA